MGSLTSSGDMDAEDSIGGFKLIWADFPTSLALSDICNEVPNWNVFGDDMVESVFVIGAEFLLRDGTIVCTLRAEHLSLLVKEAELCGFILVRTLFMHLPQVMYVNSEYGQETVSIFMCNLTCINPFEL